MWNYVAKDGLIGSDEPVEYAAKFRFEECFHQVDGIRKIPAVLSLFVANTSPRLIWK